MTRTGRAETVAQVLILLLIAGMAGTASFTHVHDWTMRNAPPGTGSWLGGANAVISDLTPTAAGIEIRRRKRHHQSIGYPMTVLIAAAILSLAAQVAQARPTLAGWTSSAVPALAFLALTKLILGRNTAPNGEPSCATATTLTAPAAPTNSTSTPGTSKTASSCSPTGNGVTSSGRWPCHPTRRYATS